MNHDRTDTARATELYLLVVLCFFAAVAMFEGLKP